MKFRRPLACQWWTNPKEACTNATPAASEGEVRGEQAEERAEPLPLLHRSHSGAAEAAAAGHSLHALKVAADDPHVPDGKPGIGERVDAVLGMQVAVGHRHNCGPAPTLSGVGVSGMRSSTPPPSFSWYAPTILHLVGTIKLIG